MKNYLTFALHSPTSPQYTCLGEIHLHMEHIICVSQFLTTKHILTEINTCLRNLNSASAPGDDKLTYGVVQRFNNSLPHALPDLFRALSQYKCFPQEWKHANCNILQKQGRAKQGNPKGYRPISLLPYMGKIFEKIAAKRIATAGVQ
jgi:hypothetical protein